jgi:hypothetical protein
MIFVPAQAFQKLLIAMTSEQRESVIGKQIGYFDYISRDFSHPSSQYRD